MKRKRAKLPQPPAGMWSRVWYLNRTRRWVKQCHIPEGAKAEQIPADGHGRIDSNPLLGERYATTCRGGWRLFVAWGRYGLPVDPRMRRRFWFKQL